MLRRVKEAGHLGQNLFTLGFVIPPQEDLARPLLLHFLHDEGACFTDLDGGPCHGRPPGSNALPHFIRGIVEKGDQLIVSDLRVALPDMKVAPQPSTAYPELVMATQ